MLTKYESSLQVCISGLFVYVCSRCINIHLTFRCSEIICAVIFLQNSALLHSQIKHFWLHATCLVLQQLPLIDVCLTYELNQHANLWMQHEGKTQNIFSKKRLQTSFKISSGCLPVTNNRSHVSLTLDCTVHLLFLLISSTNLWARTGRTLREVGIDWMLSLAVCLLSHMYISTIRYPFI